MEDEARRSGLDRREQQREHNEAEKRQSQDRRELIKDPGRTIELMKKIPIFRGLDDEDYKKLQDLCEKKYRKRRGPLQKRG